MWCRRNILTINGMLMERENCRMDGQVSQHSLYWMKNHGMGIHGPGRDLQENKVLLVLTKYGQIVDAYVQHALPCRNPNKDGPWRNLLAVLGQWTRPNMLVLSKLTNLEIQAHDRKAYSKKVSSRSTLLAQGIKFTQTHDNLVHKFVPVPQAMKIPDAKAAVEKWMEETGEQLPAWQLTKIRNMKDVIAEARNEGRTSSLSHRQWISVISRIRSWNQNYQKIQRSSCVPRWLCKRWFWCVCSIHLARIISITNDSRRRHGH